MGLLVRHKANAVAVCISRWRRMIRVRAVLQKSGEQLISPEAGLYQCGVRKWQSVGVEIVACVRAHAKRVVLEILLGCWREGWLSMRNERGVWSKGSNQLGVRPIHAVHDPIIARWMQRKERRRGVEYRWWY